MCFSTNINIYSAHGSDTPRSRNGISSFKEIIYNGKEFLGKEFNEMIESLGIELTPTKTPQAKLVECIHLG